MIKKCINWLYVLLWMCVIFYFSSQPNLKSDLPSMWDFILARGARTDEPVTAVLFFWVVNSIGIWLVARMAHFTGLGLASFFWALILGAVIDILQRLSWKLVTSQGKKVI